MEFIHFFDTIQKTCLPGIWSKGVAISRNDSIVEDLRRPDEIVLRVQSKDRPVSRKVTLWPKDEDWYCDCDDKNDVCPHVAAAVIAIRSGKLQGALSKSAANSNITQIQYHFFSRNHQLIFERWLVFPPEKKEILRDSLTRFSGGLSSGRISYPPLLATQEDFAVDSIISSKKDEILDSHTLVRLFKILSRCSPIFFQDKPILVSPNALNLSARVIDEKDGVRLEMLTTLSLESNFRNGALLDGETLRAIEIPKLSFEENLLLSSEGRFFHSREFENLVVTILPSLRSKIPIDIKTNRLPIVKQVLPRIILEMRKLENSETLFVTPRIIYEEIPKSNEGKIIYLPDPAAEKTLNRKLQNELQLNLGQTSRFEAEAALDFKLRLDEKNERETQRQERTGSAPQHWEVEGSGYNAFSLGDPLTGSLEFDQSDFKISFTTESGKSADANAVVRAWRENQQYLPLLEGGWAPLPSNWLEKFGDKIESLLNLKKEYSVLPKYVIPELLDLCEQLDQEIPPNLVSFKNAIQSINKIPESILPTDLTAQLRPYQRLGINWLCFLRDHQLGAMLADDMGLGKTLQALCSIQGRTLIIAPTSVLQSWKLQISAFRPTLSVCLYHGSSRELEPEKDIVLSTYALLRLDQSIICKYKWDTIILDETQIIKNPDSQIAKAAHNLQANFKIALSGTPIENRIEDLWSQFQFITPGLLGSLESFKDSYNKPNQSLQSKIKPFILRRLKKDVAPELPPKTEIVLYCELNSDERDVYSAILATTRKEVLEKLEQEKNIFDALELLLRLRQACCHSQLVPGQKIQNNTSSKIELLTQTLQNSIANGHRALVFSQWTSYLDLIEQNLNENSITSTRLDGSTKNRDQIVAGFQDPTGPSVMLISLKAGGMGLTLTAADHVFIMDPWWNPAVENQAGDRAHRIGQLNPVLIHRLIAQNTVEERILELQKSKIHLALQVLEGSLGSNSISRDDLLSLLKEI